MKKELTKNKLKECLELNKKLRENLLEMLLKLEKLDTIIIKKIK